MHTPHAVVDAHMVGQAAMPYKVGPHKGSAKVHASAAFWAVDVVMQFKNK